LRGLVKGTWPEAGGESISRSIGYLAALFAISGFAAVHASAGHANELNQSGNETSFHVQGVGAYNASEILGYAAQVEVQRTGKVTARGLAAVLETLYHEDGYFLATAIVSSDGRTILVDEGEIGTIAVEGVDARTFKLIEGYFAPVIGKPGVTLAEFERAIMLVEDIQSISASAEITYPEGVRTAHLRVVAEQLDRSSGYVTLDNPSRDFGDAVTLTFSQEFISLLTPGDLFRLELSGTKSLEDGDSDLFGSANYRLPVGGAGTYAETYFGNAVGDRDAKGSLRQTDLEGRNAIVALGHPFVRDVDTYGYGLVELRRTSSDTDVDGSPIDYDSDVNVAGASWIYGKALQNGGAYEYAVNLSIGERTSDPDGFDDGDKSFWHLRAGGGYQRPVSWFGANSAVSLEFWGQYSPDRLPGIEEFYLGGIDAERGFVFAESNGDSGFSMTIEAGRDFFPGTAGIRRLRPFGFVDFGYIDNNDPAPEEQADDVLSSVGIGLDAELPNGVFIQSYVAVPLTPGPETDQGDPAIYLALSKSW